MADGDIGHSRPNWRESPRVDGAVVEERLGRRVVGNLGSGPEFARGRVEVVRGGSVSGAVVGGSAGGDVGRQVLGDGAEIRHDRSDAAGEGGNAVQRRGQIGVLRAN